MPFVQITVCEGAYISLFDITSPRKYIQALIIPWIIPGPLSLPPCQKPACKQWDTLPGLMQLLRTRPGWNAVLKIPWTC